MKKTLVALSLVAFFTAAPATAQVDLSRYVALGDSGSAGFVSGSLMNFYQQRAFPALLAEQAGVSGFELPTVSEPGIPPILELVHLVPTPVIAPVAPFEESGLPTNALFPGIYNNLAVPGATLYDMLFTTGDIYNLIAGNFDDPMHDLILRNGINTALEQGIGLQPTFVTVWIGLNDILPTALTGTPIEGVTMTPVESFEMLYNNAIGALMTNTSADIVLINLPDITTMPFSTSVAPFVEIPGDASGRFFDRDGLRPARRTAPARGSQLHHPGTRLCTAPGRGGDHRRSGGGIQPDHRRCCRCLRPSGA
jgi:hypothetical protein